MAFRVHGCSAITCVTAQNTCGVERVDALPPDGLKAQFQAVQKDLAIDAVKTGMLLNSELIQTTAAMLEPLAIPKVIDPVMFEPHRGCTAGGPGHPSPAPGLLPQATLVTPTAMKRGCRAVLS